MWRRCLGICLAGNGWGQTDAAPFKANLRTRTICGSDLRHGRDEAEARDPAQSFKLGISATIRRALEKGDGVLVSANLHGNVLVVFRLRISELSFFCEFSSGFSGITV